MPENVKYKAIVIGASAGGLYALLEIIEKLPTDFPIPIIVVQHRSKDNNYLFEEVLQNKCTITIRQADEKEKIKSGTIYIAPPDYHLLIEEDKTFSLTADFPVRYSRPSIDVLFESAAMVYKEALIGIILTGANNDGTAGMIAIKNNGGLTIAQDPDEAMFPAMPAASIKEGVTYIWKLEVIGKFLLSLLNT